MKTCNVLPTFNEVKRGKIFSFTQVGQAKRAVKYKSYFILLNKISQPAVIYRGRELYVCKTKSSLYTQYKKQDINKIFTYYITKLKI